MAGPYVLPTVTVTSAGVSSLTGTLLEERQRMAITDLNNGQSLFVQFNPTEFTENLAVNYSRHVVPGLSHQVMQYVSTENDKFEFDLFFAADTRAQVVQNLAARRQIQSYHYPRATDNQLIGAGPPRLLFVWPQFISLTCVIVNSSFVYQKFSPSGLPIQFTASIALEEIRNVRLLSDDILQNGSKRAGLQETALEDIEFLDE